MPLNMPRFELQDYVNAGCMQATADGSRALICAYVHKDTDGRMCEGCPEYNEGQCKAYKSLTKKV